MRLGCGGSSVRPILHWPSPLAPLLLTALPINPSPVATGEGSPQGRMRAFRSKGLTDLFKYFCYISFDLLVRPTTFSVPLKERFIDNSPLFSPLPLARERG